MKSWRTQHNSGPACHPSQHTPGCALPPVGGLMRSLPYLGLLCMLSEVLSIARCPWLKKRYLLCWYVTVYACFDQTRFVGAYCVWETSKSYISPQLYLYALNLLSDFKLRPFLKILLFLNCTFKKKFCSILTSINGIIHSEVWFSLHRIVL